MTSVLIVTPSVSPAGGGVPEAVRLLAKLFVDSPDVRVQVVALDDVRGSATKAGWDGIAVETFSYRGPSSYSFSPQLFWRVLRSNADVIHVHGVWQFHCLAAYCAYLLHGTRYIVTPHGMLESWIRRRSRALKWLVSMFYQDRFLRKSTALQILTEKERVDVIDKVSDAQCVLIPNYVPEAVAVDGLPGWWSPDFHGRTIYLFFGRIHEKKGCLELCEAWHILCQDDEFRARSALVFCGVVDGIESFERVVSDLGKRLGNIIYAGERFGAEKGRSLAAASFLILPSRSEGMPLAILEAWAAGIPAIISPECNLDVGFRIGAAVKTSSTPEAIAASIRQADLMGEFDRRAMGERGRRLVAAEFSASTARDVFKTLYVRTAALSRNRQRDTTISAA